jgi:hypothetical protein
MSMCSATYAQRELALPFYEQGRNEESTQLMEHVRVGV